MEKTPVLSKKAQKNTLSGKKKKKETIKNVLANPYSHYFPLATEEESKCILDVIRQLPRLKCEKINVPWSVMKAVAKAERKEAREAYVQNVMLEKGIVKEDVDENIKENLIYGVNDVTKLLEANEAAAVLISSDVNPQLLIKHVLDLAVLKETPALVVQDLRKTSATTTGIACAALSIKSNYLKESVLHKMVLQVSKLAKNYPPPENHCNRKVKGGENELDETMQNLDLEQVQVKIVETVKPTYLVRTNVKSRAFVPPSSNAVEVSSIKMEVDEGFIGFTKVKSESRSVQYKGLKVKRIRNNKNRKKKGKGKYL